MITYLSPLSSVLAQEAAPILPPWALVVIFILLVILFVWLLLRWQSGRVGARVQPAEEKLPEPELRRVSVKATEPIAAAAPETVLTAPPPVAVVDDLEIIEGIGPKIAGVLKQAGVTSFAQLAEMQPERIAEILQAGGIRLADPRTWPQQARLAAAGDQAALKALQDRLKSGREV